MSISLLVARFSASPHRVTAVLGLQSTTTKTKGDLLGSGRASPTNAWELEVFAGAVKSGSDHEAAIRQLMHILDGRETAFEQLKKELKPERLLVVGEVELPCVQSRGEHGLWMEAHEMRLLSACGLGWGVDLNVR